MPPTHDTPGPDRDSDARNGDSDDDPLPREACAWCGRLLRDGPEPTSHGICPDCMARLENSVKHPRE